MYLKNFFFLKKNYKEMMGRQPRFGAHMTGLTI